MINSAPSFPQLAAFEVTAEDDCDKPIVRFLKINWIATQKYSSRGKQAELYDLEQPLQRGFIKLPIKPPSANATGKNDLGLRWYFLNGPRVSQERQ